MTLGQLIIETQGAFKLDPDSTIRHMIVTVLSPYQLLSYQSLKTKGA